jgi:ribosomal 50S subunit-recycling heat shock protein
VRIDKFLNVVNIVKRRSLSEEMCKSKVVKINDKVVKAAKEVKVGDVIEIQYVDYSKKWEVLQIPTTKTLPKSLKDEYVKEIK